MATGLEPYYGPAAGVGASVLWTFSAQFFTAAGRRIGPTGVNGIRIGLAIVMFAITHRLLTGLWVPHALSGQILLLAASGVLGLSLGDQALFMAFVDIGPRLSMLVLATAPIFATICGWLALGERLPAVAWAGMAVTLTGVCWVVLERPESPGAVDRPGAVPAGCRDRSPSPHPLAPSGHRSHRLRGVVLAFVASLCQAGAFMLVKQGMGHGWLPREQHLDPQAAALVRMFFAGLGFLPILLIHHLRQRRKLAAGVPVAGQGPLGPGLFLAACGSVVGPFIGMWFSLIANDRVQLGIAQTLCSLAPVFILPFAVTIQKERVSIRAAVGAVVAVSGSAILFLCGR